jgi:hypothetical protein
MNPVSVASPQTGAAAAPVNNLVLGPSGLSTRGQDRPSLPLGQLSSSSLTNSASADQDSSLLLHPSSPQSPKSTRRRRSHSGDQNMSSPRSSISSRSGRKVLTDASTALAKALSRTAQKTNDAMVYLDGPQLYTCAQCRTHLTSHDEIISKSFHGRHGKFCEVNLSLLIRLEIWYIIVYSPSRFITGRAYLFDHCVNVTIGPAEDRQLITGMHSVCDIFCKRCKNMVGWTYAKAYEASQKYKEGKFIIEKINLHLEESDYYDVAPPAGERKDRFRARSISWGSDCPLSPRSDLVYEYHPASPTPASAAG